ADLETTSGSARRQADAARVRPAPRHSVSPIFDRHPGKEYAQARPCVCVVVIQACRQRAADQNESLAWRADARRCNRVERDTALHARGNREHYLGAGGPRRLPTGDGALLLTWLTSG